MLKAETVARPRSITAARHACDIGNPEAKLDSLILLSCS
jgi:hypothetical protein